MLVETLSGGDMVETLNWGEMVILYVFGGIVQFTFDDEGQEMKSSFCCNWDASW